MPDIRVIITNIRKVAAIMFWTMVGLFVLYIDHATIGAASRTIVAYLELVGIQGMDKVVVLMIAPSSLFMQIFSLVRVGAIVVKIVSIMLVAVPMFAVLVIGRNISYLVSLQNASSKSNEQAVDCQQGAYLINNTFRC